MKYAALLALALAAAPAARAEPACEDIRTLTDLALEGFKSIKLGPTVYDKRTYNASLVLPRADECVVRGSSVVTYECAWTYDGFDTLNLAHERLMTTLRSCLSDWEVVQEQKNVQELNDIEITTFGATLLGNGVHDSVTVRSWGVETILQGAGIRALRLRITVKDVPKVA